MIVNPYSPQAPIVNKEPPARTQVSPDSSPESTVVQNRNVAPVPDVRVVQQANESSSSNGLQDPKLDVKQEGAAKDLNAGDKPVAPGQVAANPNELLSEDELRQVEQLATRDREVRAHEQAHLSAAGSRATSAASFTYTDGPDGKRYATGGEVRIDTSPVQGDPEATLRAAELIQRAALAPASPSAQDMQVAAAANGMAQVATAELSQQRAEEARAPQASEQSTSPAVGDGEVSGEAAVGAIAEVSSESASEVVVDTRDVQIQNRQQLLENVFDAVQRGLEGDPRGANVDSFNPVAQAGNAIQPRAVNVSVAQGEDGAKVSVAVPEDRVIAAPLANAEKDGDSNAVRESQAISASTVSPAATIKAEAVAADNLPKATQIDQRGEEIKSRQLQLESTFNAEAQGLGGEPRGTNLDYFL